VSTNNIPKEEELIFAFMTLNTYDLKVLATLVPTNDLSHNVILHRSNEAIEKGVTGDKCH